MGWKETRLFKAFTGPQGMKELRPRRKTQQRPPKDAVSSGSAPPNETHWIDHAQVGSSRLAPRSTARLCPADHSAPFQLSQEPKTSSILQDTVVL